MGKLEELNKGIEKIKKEIKDKEGELRKSIQKKKK